MYRGEIGAHGGIYIERERKRERDADGSISSLREKSKEAMDEDRGIKKEAQLPPPQ